MAEESFKDIFPELSNSVSPPAEPGVYSGEISDPRKLSLPKFYAKCPAACRGDECMLYIKRGNGKTIKKSIYRRNTMKRMVLCCVLVAFCLSMGSKLWALDDDVKEIPSCKYCGMNRETFAHSRMHIEYNDNTKEGLCSLHCAAVDLALNMDKTPKMIQVGDYGTKGLINAETAVLVIGGNKPGVMTKNAKWAFAHKEDAEKYRQENGGRIATFDETLEAAYKDLAEDTKMIRERRKMQKMKMMEKKP